MKCEKCGNEYPSRYYFKTPDVCKECFNKMSPEEQRDLLTLTEFSVPFHENEYRIGFGRRLGAFLIDGVISALVLFIVFKMSGYYDALADAIQVVINHGSDMDYVNRYLEQMTASHQFSIIFPTIFSLVYYSLEVLIGASIGKLVLGIRIGSQDRTYAASSQLFMRYVFKHLNNVIALLAFVAASSMLDLLGTIIFVVWLVGCFFVLSFRRQAFHDMLSGTAVYHKSDIKEEIN